MLKSYDSTIVLRSDGNQALGMKTYRFQVVKSQVTSQQQLLKQNWHRMFLIEVTY